MTKRVRIGRVQKVLPKDKDERALGASRNKAETAEDELVSDKMNGAKHM